MRDLEVRIRVVDNKVNWKIAEIPRSRTGVTSKELEKIGNALETVRLGVLTRRSKKFKGDRSSGNSEILERILSQIDTSRIGIDNK